MDEAQHSLLRLGLIRDACDEVRRGLEADARSKISLPGGWRLVAAVEAWATSPEATIRRAVLVPTAGVAAAMQVALGESGRPSEPLALALRAAAQPPALPERLPFVTRAVAQHCERAAVLAGQAIAGRWLLDAAYATLLGVEPPPLSALTLL